MHKLMHDNLISDNWEVRPMFWKWGGENEWKCAPRQERHARTSRDWWRRRARAKAARATCGSASWTKTAILRALIMVDYMGYEIIVRVLMYSLMDFSNVLEDVCCKCSNDTLPKCLKRLTLGHARIIMWFHNAVTAVKVILSLENSWKIH